ncbi:hypothetical protein BpHYR1_031555 [Brachionus plicatilis]|uniref:Uncharacterized protein n=1 Tax=Brachionus plicatilis TaxID=10195 RepID=A0A3M7PBN7_BRAPC|nr:hypothetical protein BpHYR1_031555 [Brachionus plicatilis]
MDSMSMISCNNALKLRPLLAEKCVILTGGRDKLNNILVQFPFDSQLEKLSSDDLQTRPYHEITRLILIK